MPLTADSTIRARADIRRLNSDAAALPADGGGHGSGTVYVHPGMKTKPFSEIFVTVLQEFSSQTLDNRAEMMYSCACNPYIFERKVIAMKKFAALFLALMMAFSMVAMAETIPSPEAPIIPSPDAPIVPSPDAPIVPSPDAPIIPSPIASPDADAFTSASVANYYAANALTGDDLMNAVNSQSGFYIIATTNPDGSANAAFFIFAIQKLNDKYYLQLGLAENQTKTNLEANGTGVAVYAANPTAEQTYAVAGARMTFVTIEDEAVLAELTKDARQGAMFFEITEILPLG